MYSTDVLAQYQVAESLLGRRAFLTADEGWTVEGVRGSGRYVPHGLGWSVLLVPAAAAGAMLGASAGKVATAATAAAASLILMIMWHKLAERRFGRVSALRMAALGVGCMVLVYGRLPFDVTAAAASALVGLVLMDRDRPVWAGVFMGIALLVRLDSALLLPAFWRDWRRSWRLAWGLAPFLMVIMAANWYRFGSPFDDGHSQDPAMAVDLGIRGVAGLVVSPGKGLLWFAPVFVLALALNRSWRLIAPFALALLLHGILHDWTGGTGWGPRFMLPSLPLLALPLARPGRGGALFWVLAGWGALLALGAAWSDPAAVEQAMGPDLIDTAGRQSVVWSFSGSPLFACLRRIGEGAPDLLGAHLASAVGIPAALGAACQAAAALVLAGASRMVGRGA
jgi:hypothetical protein